MKGLDRQIVARIPKELDERLRRRAQASQRRCSEIVRLALEAYLAESEGPVRDRIGHLIGSLSDGLPDLSTNRKHLLRAFRDRR